MPLLRTGGGWINGQEIGTMFTFLSPLFLIGLLAAGIPLIIHLSRSRRTKKIRFSTTRFFTDQFLRSYRMSRLKELLLLAMRMALCAFLAVALAQPLLLPRGSTLFGGSRAVVLVLDNSASMGYVENGTTLLDRARAAGREVLESLRPGDHASVVLAGRRPGGPEVLFPELTPARDEVLQAVDAVQVEALGTDLSGAVARAEALARGSSASSKEVYVLSDLQDSGWEIHNQDAATQQGSDVLHFFVSIRPKEPSNAAITALQYAAARPMVGVPFAIQPHLSIQGNQAGAARVALHVDGQKVRERAVEKKPGGRWAIPRFYHAFTTGGWHSGYVEVQDEKMPLDNRRYFTFEVLDSIKLLAVNGAPSKVPRQDELFFLKAALTAGPEGKSPIQVTEIGPAELANADLKDYPLVIAANVEAFSAPAVEKLEAFVDRGGSLLFFLGDRVNETSYNQNLAAASRLHGGLLPGRLLNVEGDKTGPETFAFIADVDYDHVALAAFQDPKFANLAGVGLRAFYGVDPTPSAAVLMKANNGKPLLVEKAFGKGRVMLFAGTCDRDWTNFPVRPAYLPFVHRLVGYLAQEPLGRQTFFTTGEAVPVPVSAAEGLPQLVVRKPDKSTGFPVATSDKDNPLVFRDTTVPGVYTVVRGDGQGTLGAFAVNLESYESDLTYLDDVLFEREDGRSYASRSEKIQAGLRDLLPGQTAELITYVDDPSKLLDVSLGSRRGAPLWDWVLLVVLLLALAEPWLANRISLRHYAKPRELPAVPAPGAAARVADRPEIPAPTQEVVS
jgi:hypothetical protein